MAIVSRVPESFFLVLRAALLVILLAFAVWAMLGGRTPQTEHRHALLTVEASPGVDWLFVFWNVFIPAVPLILLIGGHDLWRRSCPLAFAGSLPRTVAAWLGRSAGERALPEWMQRNAWHIQGSLLVVLVTSRLFGVDSDPLATGLLVLGLLLGSMVLVSRYGGRAWCHALCPVNPVQKFYTQPRGLIDARAHRQRGDIRQSGCRTIGGRGGEKPACTSCVKQCPDTDLEAHYWQDVDAPGRRWFYFIYPGLVLAFATAPHGSTGLAEAPFHRFADLLPWMQLGLPRALSVPLHVALCLVGSYVGCSLGIRAMGWVHERLGRPLHSADLHHRFYRLLVVLACLLSYTAVISTHGDLGREATLVFGCVIAAALATWSASAWLRNRNAYQLDVAAERVRRRFELEGLPAGAHLAGRSLATATPEQIIALEALLPTTSIDRRGSGRLGAATIPP